MPSPRSFARPACTDRGNGMLKNIATSLFGTRHTREMRRVQPIVDEINAEYERLHAVSDEELRGADREAPRHHRRARASARGEDRGAARAEALVARSRRCASASIARSTAPTARAGSTASCATTIAEALDEILPEAFATVREARATPRRHDGHGHRTRDAVEHGALRRAAHRRHPAALRQDRGDGDR